MLCEDSFAKLMNHLNAFDISIKTEIDQHTKAECIKIEPSLDTFDASETYTQSEDNENESVSNDKDFNKQPAMKTDKHINHTDDGLLNSITNYNCDLCEATFNNKSALIKHEISHKGSKPYFCEICQKSTVFFKIFNNFFIGQHYFPS